MGKQNIQAINKWQAENTELIRIRPRKDEYLIERIQMAVDAGKTKSRQGFIIEAIKEKLERDGIPFIDPFIETTDNEAPGE